MSNFPGESRGRYYPRERDIHDVMVANREYTRELEERAALRALRSLSPALEAMATRTEEALKDQVYFIESFISSHEARMRRLEKKLERGFARLETRIIDLETSIKELDISSQSQGPSPIESDPSEP
jgi:predicted  nucleic acid-binding Zn-ribbon protein